MTTAEPPSTRLRAAVKPVGTFMRGFVSPVRALKLLLGTRGLKRYALLPMLVNVILFIILTVIFFGWLLRSIDLAEYVPSWLGWAETGVGWAVTGMKYLIGAAVYVIFCFFGFTTIGMVVASPFNDLLSERVEEVLCTGRNNPEVKLKVWAQATIFSLWESTKIALMQTALTIVALPFLLIPVAGAAPIYLVGAYFGGLGFMDVALARHFLGAKYRKVGFAGRRMEIFGLGTAMALMMMIPLVGMLILPLGVTAGTILYCEIDWEERLAAAELQPPPGFVPPEISS